MDDPGLPSRGIPHSAHWGSFFARRDGDQLVVTLHPEDPAPSPILGNFADILRHKARIRRPMVRRGWLEAGPRPRERNFADDLVANLSTGAWYDPVEDGSGQPLCGHGNPNVVTRDIGTSRLAQGSCGQVTTVQCARFDGEAPPLRAYDPPRAAGGL